MTSAMIKAISENSGKRATCFQSQGKGVVLVTFHSEIWGETEKPGRIMNTKAIIGDDYTSLPNTFQVSGRGGGGDFNFICTGVCRHRIRKLTHPQTKAGPLINKNRPIRRLFTIEID